MRTDALATRGVWLPLLLLGGGCSGLFQSNARPEQVYYLRAPAASGTPDSGSTAPAALGASLRVGRVLADPGLDSSHIMLVQADHRMNFYSGSRWPAPISDVLGALAVDTLRSSGVWTSVEDSASPFPSQYLLQLAVRRFEADYTANAAAPEVHVRLDCTVGRREGRDVVATFVATGSAPAAANRLGDVVTAFEHAAGTALESLAQQAAQAVREAQRSAKQDAARRAAERASE